MTAADTLTAARESLAAHAPTLAAARARVAACDKIAAQLADYNVRLIALGSAPVVPDAVDAPTEPANPRPTPEQEGQALATRRLAAESVGAIRLASENAATTAAAKRVSDDAAATASKAARRVVALVDAIRKAPSIIGAQQLDLLGDLGRVGLSFPPPAEPGEPAAPACVLTFDGLPIRVASGGQKLYAGITLAVGIRKGAGMPLVPIFAEDWGRYDGGKSPGPEGDRIVYLVTTEAGTALTITPTEPK